MPTYDYECTNGHRFERFQQMSDPLLKKCPKCGRKVKRLIGAGAGILFKGSGFYITDYRSADYNSKAKADKDGGASKGADGGAKDTGGSKDAGGSGDAKPASKESAATPKPSKKAGNGSKSGRSGSKSGRGSKEG
jgi:putative FmdB family regulatory protein